MKNRDRRESAKNLLWKSTASDTMIAMDNRGFSLIELLVTVAIIGILAGAAVTAYIGSTLKAARSEAYSNLESLRLLEERFFADRGRYTNVDLGVTTSTDCDTGAEAEANANDIRTRADNSLLLFRPGNDAQFCYYILEDEDITGAATADDCFTAYAVGLDNLRVEGDVFAIDCNNDRTF